MLVTGVLMPAFVITPLLVRDEFGGGVNQVDIMESIGGIGMVMGGVLITLIALTARRIVVVLVTNAVSCAAIALTGLVSGDMFWLAVLWWFVSGITFTIGSAPMMAILQSVVPNQIQGRALSPFSTMMGIASLIGLAFAAPLDGWIGTRGLLVSGGVLATIVCLSGFLSPSLMRIEAQPLKLDL